MISAASGSVHYWKISDEKMESVGFKCIYSI